MEALSLTSAELGDRMLDESLDFKTPELQAAYRLWAEKCGAKTMPSRSDFSHDDLAPFMGNIALINVENQPVRYQFRLIGTNITSIVKRDMTSGYLDEIYDVDAFSNVVRSFEYILENRRPVRAFGNVSHAEKGHLNVEVLDAPLASDGQTIDMIIKFVKWTR